MARVRMYWPYLPREAVWPATDPELGTVRTFIAPNLSLPRPRRKNHFHHRGIVGEWPAIHRVSGQARGFAYPPYPAIPPRHRRVGDHAQGQESGLYRLDFGDFPRGRTEGWARPSSLALISSALSGAGWNLERARARVWFLPDRLRMEILDALFPQPFSPPPSL